MIAFPLRNCSAENEEGRTIQPGVDGENTAADLKFSWMTWGSC
jgi:hypothetical protein